MIPMFLIDTNVFIDIFQSGFLHVLDNALFSVSSLVMFDEIRVMIPQIELGQLIFWSETSKNIEDAIAYSRVNKKISFYDALNGYVASENRFILVTRDKKLINFARTLGVECKTTVEFLRYMSSNRVITFEEHIKILETLLNQNPPRIAESLLNKEISDIKAVLDSSKIVA